MLKAVRDELGALLRRPAVTSRTAAVTHARSAGFLQSGVSEREDEKLLPSRCSVEVWAVGGCSAIELR